MRHAHRMGRSHRRRRPRGMALLEVIVFTAALLAFWQALRVLSGWWRTAGEARFVAGEVLNAAARTGRVPREVVLADGTPMQFQLERTGAGASLVEELARIGVRYAGEIPADALLPPEFVPRTGGWLTVRAELPAGTFGGGVVVSTSTIERLLGVPADPHGSGEAWRRAVEEHLIDHFQPFD